MISGATAAPMITARKIRRIISKFEEAGATYPKNAKTLEALNVRHGLIFRRLVKQGIFVEANPQHYYLSNENLNVYYERRKMSRKIVLGIMVLIIIVALLFSYFA